MWIISWINAKLPLITRDYDIGHTIRTLQDTNLMQMLNKFRVHIRLMLKDEAGELLC